MPNKGNSSARAPRAGKAGAPRSYKPREDGREGRSPQREAKVYKPKGEKREGGYAPRDSRDGYKPRENRDGFKPRETRDGRPDRGRDWTPPADGARKPRYNADDRARRDERPARDGERRTYAPRDGERRSFGSRDGAPRREFGSRDGAPRRDFGSRDGAPRREFGSRDDRPARTWEPRGERRDFGSRDDRPAREERPARREFGARDGGQRRDYGSRDASRDGQRRDRVERDQSRDRSFEGARERTPNKKAFFEDVVLERLDAVPDSEALIVESFADMGLHPRILEALSGMGAESPFPIQAATIPSALEGQDVLGRGKTGSGKTIAFSVPLVSKLIQAGSRPRNPGKPRALILAPTRELADQIDRTVKGLARAAGFFTVCIYGGVPQRKQEVAMDRGTDIIVATPGRLEDLMAQGIVDLSEVETMVVDEADHMCDLGFIEPVRRIMRAAGDCQKLLFSATLDREVDSLVKEFLPNPYVYQVPDEEEDNSNIIHRVLTVDEQDRSQVLLRLVQGHGKSLIFTRTKMTAERLSESLTAAGVPAARLHGDLNQNQRNRNLERFVSGAVRVLVATDVAARGIHVDDVALVIQVDPPEEYKTYLHRAGRTGRANSTGTVITLIPRSRRRRLEDLLRRADRDGIFSEVRPASELLEELAGPIAPAPAAEVLDFGDSRSGGRGGSRGGDRDRGNSGSRGGRGNFGGNGKGRWADKSAGDRRPRAKKYD
jgi:superfamily II DNA/RNA helicase